jgi:Polysaccharide lyase
VVQMPTNNPHFKEGDVVHYYWWTLFPASFVTSEKWHVWTQWHQSNNNASPPPDLEFVLHGTTLGLRAFKAPDVSDTLWSEPLRQGHWYRFQLIVKWSTGPTTGNVKLWVDGRAVVNTNHTTLATNSTPYSAYMKQGLYRDKTINHIQTIYHDGMTFHYH